MALHFSIKSVSAVVTGLLVGLSIGTMPGLANESSNLRQGLPGRRISGGVRMEPPSDSCFTDFNQSLVSVMPQSNLGLTLAAHPTLWFSMPETMGSKAVEFRLFNSAEDLVYTTQLESNNRFGITEFQVPESAPALAIDEDYSWVLTLACNNGSSSPTLGLQGQIRRVEITQEMTNQLNSASPEERVQLYGNAGLWHEQVTELANLRRRQSANTDIQLAWITLMNSTGLSGHLSSNLTEQMNVVDTANEEQAIVGNANFEN